MKRLYLLPVFAVLVAALFLGAGFLAAEAGRLDTCTVPSVEYASIQEAVNDPLCQTVMLGADTFYENVVITRTVSIGGEGAGATVVDGGAAGRTFEIPYDSAQDIVVEIFDLRVTNGDASAAQYGGGIYNDETLTLQNVLVDASSAVSGGGVANGVHGLLLVLGSQVNANQASNSGGNIYNLGVMTVTASQASHATNGQGIYSTGRLSVLSAELNGNSEGGLYQGDAPLLMSDVDLKDNGSYGVRIYSLDALTDTADLEDVVVTGTSSGAGSGIGLQALGRLQVTVHNALVADSVGRGIATTANGVWTPVLTVSHSIIRENSGYGIHANGHLFIDATQIMSNTANSGAGIYRNSADKMLKITNSQISYNVASQCGGGIYIVAESDIVNTTFIVSGSTISDNRANSGAGICINGPGSLIQDTTISGNRAQTSGGGMVVGAGIGVQGPLMLVNSTVSGNSAEINGGGLELLAGVHEIRNATIVDNLADSDEDGTGLGGGLYVLGANTLTMGNSLLAQNLSGTERSDCQGTLVSLGNNLVGDDSNCSGLTVQDYYGTAAGALDPLVGPLADNGGATLTHELLPASPALDKGSEPLCTGAPVFSLDQRGGRRDNIDGNLDGGLDGNPCDIGAYERYGLLENKVYLPLVLR